MACELECSNKLTRGELIGCFFEDLAGWLAVGGIFLLTTLAVLMLIYKILFVVFNPSEDSFFYNFKIEPKYYSVGDFNLTDNTISIDGYHFRTEHMKSFSCQEKRYHGEKHQFSINFTDENYTFHFKTSEECQNVEQNFLNLGRS